MNTADSRYPLFPIKKRYSQILHNPRHEVKNSRSTHRTRDRLRHSSLEVAPVCPTQECTFQRLMQTHHYLGALPKIGNTVWYIATVEDQWIALLSFSAPALKCSARDQCKRLAKYIYPGPAGVIMMSSLSIDLPRAHHESQTTQKAGQSPALV